MCTSTSLKYLFTSQGRPPPIPSHHSSTIHHSPPTTGHQPHLPSIQQASHLCAYDAATSHANMAGVPVDPPIPDELPDFPGMANAMTTLSRNVERLGNLPGIQNPLNIADTIRDAVQLAVDQLNDRMDLKFGQMDQKFGQMDQKFGQMDQKFDQVNQGIGAVNQRIADIQLTLSSSENARRAM